MSAGLDTSVVLRLLTGVPHDQAEAARALVASASAPVVVSDLVVSETYFALRHHYAVPHAEAVRELHALLADPRIRGSGVARAVLAQGSTRNASKSQPGLFDRLVHAEYARDELPLMTFDRGLARLQGTRLVGSNAP